MRKRPNHPDIRVWLRGPRQEPVIPDRREPLEKARDEWLERHTWDRSVPVESRKLYQPTVEEHGVRIEAHIKGQVGAWFPLPHEVASCCAAHEQNVLRARMWPMTNGLFVHVATYTHLATKHGVDVKELKAAVKAELERRGAEQTLNALGGLEDD